jgi:hypothetical protein
MRCVVLLHLFVYSCVFLSSCFRVKFTGLTQNLQVDLAVWLKIPIRAVIELTLQILGQPCGFQVSALGMLSLAAAHLNDTYVLSDNLLMPEGRPAYNCAT